MDVLTFSCTINVLSVKLFRIPIFLFDSNDITVRINILYIKNLKLDYRNRQRVKEVSYEENTGNRKRN